jgi:hypothetical protein
MTKRKGAFMSRLGYYCRSCQHFRENIHDSLTRHVLAAKDSLCEMDQDPFGNCQCSHYLPLTLIKIKAANLNSIKEAANY